MKSLQRYIFKTIKSALFVVGMGAWGTSAFGVTLFNETFESTIYTDNGNLPIGTGKITSGLWSTQVTGSATAISSTAQAFTGFRSLALSTTNATDRMQVVGNFGNDSNTVGTPTTSAIDFKMQFYLTDVSRPALLVIRDSAHQNGVFLQLGNAGRLMMGSSGSYTNMYSSLLVNTWYTLDIRVDAPTGGASYTSTLFDATGNIQLASNTGSLYAANVSSDWAYFSIISGQGAILTDYFDNIKVMSIPEPTLNMVVAAVFGFFGGVGRLYRKRSSNIKQEFHETKKQFK